jgi:hypothetical protein
LPTTTSTPTTPVIATAVALAVVVALMTALFGLLCRETAGPHRVPTARLEPVPAG